MDTPFDVIIAGGGLAGVLAAARLAAARPGIRIALVERERELGGRLRATARDRLLYGYGLNAISDKLFDFLGQTLRGGDPEAPAELPLTERRQARFGVLAGNRIVEAPIEAWFTAKGARTLGGLTAARQWPEVEAIFRQGAVKTAKDEDDDDEADEADEAKAAKTHPFAHYWKLPRKVPAAVVLEHFGSAFGIPDVWNAATEAIAERAAFHAGRLHCGSFDAALAALTERPSFLAAVTVLTGNRIVDARLEGDAWEVEAEKGKLRGRALLVAQPPWTAAGWLRRSFWPAHLLQVASKTKPVSVVVLAEELLRQDAGIPDVIIVPAERVQAVRNGAAEITFQATIDFELSLQAPAVVKAVKSLKRARKKLQLLHPGLVSERNHIALQTVAWAQSPAQADRRWLARLGRKPFSSSTLAFCGDAYGAGYDGDANLIRSLLDACAAVEKDPGRQAATPTAARDDAAGSEAGA